MIVLDTNVLSETMRPTPDTQVLRWMAARPAVGLFSTTITEAEILLGLALLPEGGRRRDLETQARAMFAEDLKNRVLPFDGAAAARYAEIVAARRRSGSPIGHQDAQIAAIARSRGAAVATRNAKDFDECGVEIINPWKA